MAELFAVVGAIGAIAGLIDVGVKLTQDLHKMRTTFSSAPEAITLLSNDLKSLVSTLEQLRSSLDEGSKRGLGASLQLEARRNLYLGLQNCGTALTSLDQILQKFQQFDDLRGSASRLTSMKSIKNRFRWMLEEKNIREVQHSLEVHKSSLNLTLTFTARCVWD
jgi:hypothetical protein